MGWFVQIVSIEINLQVHSLSEAAALIHDLSEPFRLEHSFLRESRKARKLED